MKTTGKAFSHLITKTLLSGVLATGSLCLPTLIHAETSVATVPEGYVTLTVSAGTGSAYASSILSLPLLATSTAGGQTTGIITSVASNSLTNANAGWTAGALSTTTSPHLIRITSGVAQGRTFLISTATANTATSVTIDANEAIDLTTLGITAGTDTYEIIPCDTLASIFGTPATTGVLGGSSASQADQVLLLVKGSWRVYFYNTTSNDWRLAGVNTASNNIPIPPHSAIIYNRKANTSLTFTVTGRVPNMKRSVSVANAGYSCVSNGWPTSMTLSSSGINQISGWQSSSNSGTADLVQILVNGSWRVYYYDGTHWRMVGTNLLSDSVVIPVGGGAVINKRGSATGNALLSQTPPYAL